MEGLANKAGMLNQTKTYQDLPSDNDLFWLLLNRKKMNESSNFFGSFPLGQLPKPFLSSPNTSMDNLQEQLP
jgi:hypothetical protein